VRIEHARPIPKAFSRHPHGKGIVAEADIFQTPGARLAAKLLVFASPRDLRRFWKEALGKPDLGAGCVGAVNALGHEAIDYGKDGDGKSRWVCDPRYFCIIGLCLNHLTMEVVTHEAVHAGFCYARRRGQDPWNDDRRLGEEDVAYPAGRIAAAINRWLYDRDLYAGEVA
jgi:hypothetical protein